MCRPSGAGAGESNGLFQNVCAQMPADAFLSTQRGEIDVAISLICDIIITRNRKHQSGLASFPSSTTAFSKSPNDCLPTMAAIALRWFCNVLCFVALAFAQELMFAECHLHLG